MVDSMVNIYIYTYIYIYTKIPSRLIVDSWKFYRNKWNI